MTQDSITYEELADPKWKGKICIRSGQHTYNIALVASMIANDGEEKTEQWLTGVRDNLARKPAGGDREGVRDVQAGLCDIAIGNTYYMVQMLKNPEQKPWADSVKILFPNADGRGTHVNVSGAATRCQRPQPRQCRQADGVHGLAGSSAPLRREERRVSGRARRRGIGDRAELGSVEGRSPRAVQDCGLCVRRRPSLSIR